jgi:hypothetical protein
LNKNPDEAGAVRHALNASTGQQTDESNCSKPWMLAGWMQLSMAAQAGTEE